MDNVQSEIRKDKETLASCRENASSCPPAARLFLAIIDEGRARSGRTRVGVINRAINLAIVPTSDLAQWGVADHWSAPLETFLAVRLDGAWVILDNRRLALVPDREIRRATPLFVIDEQGVRQFVAATANAQLRDGAPASFERSSH